MTQIPVTWSNLNLTGSLVYTSPPVAGDASFFISVRKLNLVTGEITPIFTTTGEDWIFYMSVSPDVKQLVMSYMPPSPGSTSSSRVWSMLPLDGTAPPQLLFSPPTPDDHYVHAEWSPDGGSIIFSARPPPQAYRPNWFEMLMDVQVVKAHSIPSDWWSVPVNGGMPIRLTELQTIRLFASLSPDKKHIASLGGEGIFVMDEKGSNLTQLLFDPGVSGTVSWTP